MKQARQHTLARVPLARRCNELWLPCWMRGLKQRATIYVYIEIVERQLDGFAQEKKTRIALSIIYEAQW